MFVDFFYQLRAARIPVTIREYLMLLEAMEKGAAGISVEEFYVLARAAMVKDEKFFDTYDKVFSNFFKGAMNACWNPGRAQSEKSRKSKINQAAAKAKTTYLMNNII